MCLVTGSFEDVLRVKTRETTLYKIVAHPNQQVQGESKLCKLIQSFKEDCEEDCGQQVHPFACEIGGFGYCFPAHIRATRSRWQGFQNLTRLIL